MLTFQVNGKALELSIPDGSSAGDVLEVRVGDGGEQEEECLTNDKKRKRNAKEEGFTERPLGDSIMSFKTSTSDRELKIALNLPSSSSESGHRVYQQAGDGDGTHAMAWPAGLELARRMERIRSQIDVKQTFCTMLGKIK